MNGATRIERAHQAMGYLPPGQRDACINCAWAKDTKPTGACNDVWTTRCTLGKFGVANFGWCCCYRRSEKGGSA